MENGVTHFSAKSGSERTSQVLDTSVHALPDLLSHAGIGSWVYDRDNELFKFDHLMGSYYGLPSDINLSLNQVLDFIHDDDRLAVLNNLSIVSQDQVFQVRHRVGLKDGSERWFDWTGNVSDHQSDVITGVCIEVTEKIQLEYRLSTLEKDSQNFASGIPGKFGYMDRDFLVQFLSNEYLTSLGLELENVLGRHTSDVFGHDLYELRRDLFDRAFAGEVVSFEDDSWDKNGNPLFEIVTYQPDFDEQGFVCGVFTLRVDISNRRELEHSLRQVSSELTRSNGDLEQFAYVASHDLKAPLRAIQVLVEWLTEDLKDCEIADVQENLGLLSKRTSRLNKLLDDLLSYSRTGRQSEPPVQFDFAELVGEVTELLNPRENIQIVTLEGHNALETDYAALHQVMRNLIGNAIKHHPGPHARIEVQVTNMDDHHLISVSDDGDGIPDEFSDKIFKMFQTLKPRDEVEGSGMGLAIVERIISHQGGRIWLDTKADTKGATFNFTWPSNQSTH